MTRHAGRVEIDAMAAALEVKGLPASIPAF